MYGRDYMTLSETPVDEECVSLGSSDYEEKQRMESDAYIRQLERLHPVRPKGCFFKAKAFPHDFGTYHMVCVCYSTLDDEGIKFAYEVENNLPLNWDEEAKKELTEAGYFKKAKYA